VKTTFELPDSLFRSAKSAAAQAGISLRELFTQAIAEKLQPKGSANAEKPWMKGFGALGSDEALHKETCRIQSVIDAEFGVVNDEDWK
jgi:hypothetical protein